MPVQDLIDYGAVRDAATVNLSVGQAAAEGWERAMARGRAEADRQRLIKAQERKEFDADFGTIYDATEGASGYEGSQDSIVHEWKQEFAGLMANKDNMSTAEFLSKKNQILSRAKNFNAGNQALDTFTQDYFKALDEGQISDSTPAKIKEIANLHREGKLRIINDKETGEPYVIGEASWGEPIKMSIANLANGTNTLRFNQKFDTAAGLEQIAKGFEGKNLSPEQVAQVAPQEIEEMLDNESTLRAIAADEFDINASEFDELGPDAVRQQITMDLTQRLQNQYLPKQLTAAQSAQIEQGERRIALQEENLQLRRNEIAAQRESVAQAQEFHNQSVQAKQALITNFPIDLDNPKDTAAQISGTFGMNVVWDSKSKQFIDITDGKNKFVQLGTDIGSIKRHIANKSGVGLNTPTKRMSALKRFTNWLDGINPFKREGPGDKKKDKPKKEVSHSLYAPGYTKHFSGAKTDFGELSGTGSPYASDFLGSEGGQGGLIYSRKSQKEGKKGGNVVSLGALRNSYGDPIAAATYGREWTLGKNGRTKIGVHGGATYGYGKSFRDRQAQIAAFNEANPEGVWDDKTGRMTNFHDAEAKYGKGLYGFAQKTGITPVVNAQLSHDFGGDPNSGLGISALVNPLYVNAGLQYKFGKGKKNKKKNKKKK